MTPIARSLAGAAALAIASLPPRCQLAMRLPSKVQLMWTAPRHSARTCMTCPPRRMLCDKASPAKSALLSPERRRALLRGVIAGGVLGLAGDYICQRWVEEAPAVRPYSSLRIRTRRLACPWATSSTAACTAH